MFGMAGESPFDLHFQLFGIPVRVHPYFWLTTLMMLWEPDAPEIMVTGLLAFFLTVLVHELGHALTFRHYGWSSEIVLYAMGGYATGASLPTWKYVRCVAAGPLTGLAFWAVFYAVAYPFIQSNPQLVREYPSIYYFFVFMNFSGFMINLLNLLPIVPLDGGQIMSTVLQHYRRSTRSTMVLVHQISFIVAGAIAGWSAYCLNYDQDLVPYALFEWLPSEHDHYLSMSQPDPKFELIFCGYLCALNVIEYNNLKAWR